MSLFTGEARQALQEAARPKPKKGDVVVSPYAGRELKGGGMAPAEGKIMSVSGIYAYVDYGTGKGFQPEELRYFEVAGKPRKSILSKRLSRVWRVR